MNTEIAQNGVLIADLSIALSNNKILSCFVKGSELPIKKTLLGIKSARSVSSGKSGTILTLRRSFAISAAAGSISTPYRLL